MNFLRIVVMIEYGLQAGLALVGAGMVIWAMADAARRPAGIFEAHTNQTKPTWLLILGGALILGWVPPRLPSSWVAGWGCSVSPLSWPPEGTWLGRNENSSCGPNDQVKLSTCLQHRNWSYCATDNPRGMNSTNSLVGSMSH